MENDFIRGQEFYELILNKSAHTDLFTYLDATEKTSYLTRALCARILHEFVRKVLKEKESDNWDAAKELSDLYDCHTCVAHIAECYVKGIMEGQSVRRNDKDIPVFNGRGYVLKKEAQLYIERALNPDLRPVKASQKEVLRPRALEISKSQIEIWTQNNKPVNYVDVRCKSDFLKKSIKGAVNIEFKEFMNNPYLLSDKPSKYEEEYCFICDEGYKSKMAAELAITAGFKKVCYLGLLQEEKWNNM